MHAVRQKCRPKHQILILKCYPRYQKGVQEVRAQPSELSYLLYYASTRRSKLRKVGAFLERKVASDVVKGRVGNVQVSLQILTALIDRLPRDVSLIAEHILTIVDQVLRSNDLVMVEEAVSPFAAFCSSLDEASSTHYQAIVGQFAAFANLQIPVHRGLSPPVALRWRSAGFRALQAVTAAEALVGEQLAIVIPVILQYLRVLDRKSMKLLEAQDLPRKSIESEHSIENATSTTVDADRQAEEAAQRIALACFRQIFTSANRGQTRLATNAMLGFFSSSDAALEPKSHDWAIAVIELAATWAPVQDRFVILVTIMEALVRNSIRESNMAYQLLLATLVGALLRSDINMIGLSVMDVLLGLMQHILLVLQLGAHPSFKDRIDLFKTTEKVPESQDESIPSATREHLLQQLQKCIGDLATHIYYSEQISDIIATILSRLKPSPVTVAIEQPEIAVQAIARSGHLHENQSTHEFFSFTNARITALHAVKDVLLRNRGHSRNRVGLEVWADTQWLLRDSDFRVRDSYSEALLTWLKLEASELQVEPAQNIRNRLGDHMSQRTVSNASKMSRKPRLFTLEFLHLAIYDNVVEAPESTPVILQSYTLLSTLVSRLGVQAVKSGLPMVLRLQNGLQVLTLQAKKNVASLVHGYLAAVSEKFDLISTPVGHTIRGEIQRRMQLSLWNLTKNPSIPTVQHAELVPNNTTELQDQDITPFTQREALVEAIAEAYTISLRLPPGSPPTSPRREPSGPIFEQGSLLPVDIRDEMLREWSKADTIALADRQSSRIASSGHKSVESPLTAAPRSTFPPSPSVSDCPTPGSEHSNRHLRVADMRRALSGSLGHQLSKDAVESEKHAVETKDPMENHAEIREKQERRRPTPVVVKNMRTNSDSDSYAAASTPRSHRRMSTTSSSAAGEDADLNAAALRGDLNSKRLSVDLGYGLPETVPPVPPLPKHVIDDVPGNFELPPPKVTAKPVANHAKAKMRRSEPVNVQALLDSIEVGHGRQRQHPPS